MAYKLLVTIEKRYLGVAVALTTNELAFQTAQLRDVAVGLIVQAHKKDGADLNVTFVRYEDGL